MLTRGASSKLRMVRPEEALPGRPTPLSVPPRHLVTGHRMQPPFEGLELATFGMGCFWGAERRYWQAEGVPTTQVGYAGGYTPNPSYEEVCSGQTGHAEVVRVGFDPTVTSYVVLLRIFWESHDPTQGMRQGGDVGTQYRSVIYYDDQDQRLAAEATRRDFHQALTSARLGPMTTEIRPVGEFYYAEDYHQQYLARDPGGYCGLGGTGVRLPATEG